MLYSLKILHLRWGGWGELCFRKVGSQVPLAIRFTVASWDSYTVDTYLYDILCLALPLVILYMTMVSQSMCHRNDVDNSCRRSTRSYEPPIRMGAGELSAYYFSGDCAYIII